MHNYFAGAGAGAGACCVGGTSGAEGAVCVWAGGMFSMTELFFDVVKARPSDVNMNTIAAPVVNFARKLWAPRGPKTVCDAPPNAAPMSAPLPFCKRTIPIKMAETMI